MELLRDGLREALALLYRGDALVLDAAARSLYLSAAAVAVAGVVGVPLGSVLALGNLPGRSLAVLLLRAGMAVPTVLVGLLCYALLSRRGPLGGLDLLYTPWAVILGEFCLALPIVAAWTHRALRGLDPRVSETARTLGAGLFRRWTTYLSEVRQALLLALLTAFARCFTELGVALMVGGNLAYRTRTLTTATALETARGEFARGVAMGLLLLGMAGLVTAVMAWLARTDNDY